MKRFNRVFISVAAVAACCSLLSLSSCKEDDTLGGAKAIYIEMDQTDISMLVGDTVRLSAKVSNVSGKEIVTSITWSVDDPSVVDLRELTDWSRKKNSGYVAPPVVEEPDGDATEPGDDEEAEGDDSGEAAETPEAAADSEFDADGTPKGTRNPDGTITSPDGRFIYTPSKYWAIIGKQGAQGRTTNLRATLENGKFAMTTVRIERASLGGLLEPLHAQWASYYTIKDDVAWFQVDQIGIADEYGDKINFEFEFTPVEGAEEGEFILPEETFRVDRENNLIGMAYIAPSSVGKATCTLVIGDEEASSEASMEILVMPVISGGFEVIDSETGLPKRPNPDSENASNLKTKDLTKTIDINSVDSVGLCFYVKGGFADIDNAIKACKAGLLEWKVEGSGILVTSEYIDEEYLTDGLRAGFVSYIKFTSGSRPGTARISMSSPARFPEETDDTPYEGSVDFVCNITVADYNVTYPVNNIIVVYGTDTIPDDGTITIDLGLPFSLDVDTDPGESFLYRIPAVTSSAPDVLREKAVASANKHIYTFDVLKPGSATLTFEVLGVQRSVKVVVNDRVAQLDWNGDYAQSLAPGGSSTSAVHVKMASDSNNPVAQLPEGIELVWSSSNPQVAAVTADASDSRKATINALSEGETTISCTATGGYTIKYSLTVVARQDEVYTDDNTDGADVYDNANGTYDLMIMQGDDYIIITIPQSLTGKITGNDASVYIYSNGKEMSESGCSYDLTFADSGNGATMTVNGTLTLPDGTRYTFQNLTVN